MFKVKVVSHCCSGERCSPWAYRYLYNYNEMICFHNNFSGEIKKLFSKHGYAVRCCSNLNKEEIIQKVKKYSVKKNSGKFICFLSSHGDQTSLSCPDGNDIEIYDILMAANTKRLHDCPKVFFIDACRKYVWKMLICDKTITTHIQETQNYWTSYLFIYILSLSYVIWNFDLSSNSQYHMTRS